MSKKLYLETHGCQMNVHDSEKASFALEGAGYEITANPLEADLVILNTCMVREKAARKVYSRIGNLKHQFNQNKVNLPIFGVMGCVAQAETDRMFERNKDIRLVLGTQAISRLPELINQVEQGYPRAIDVRLSKTADFFELGADARQTKHIAYITITEGCNKFCSYCIVPFTRGRERSRHADRIVAEAQQLSQQGYQEVHLLGQNVNSYGLSGRFHGNDVPDAERLDEITFAKLLSRVALEARVPRIKFTTSYPRDFDESVVKVIDDHENLCEWIHLPAQSGSNRMLRAMRRGYTREEYMEKIAFIKRAKKDIAITGDIILGFPGETEEDFNETLSLVTDVEYDGLYLFNYSPRPHTPAAAYSDSVPEEIKTERLMKLNELQKRIQIRRYNRYLDRIVEVLVEGESVRSAEDYSGHTRCHKVVNFPQVRGAIGKLVNVKITNIKQNSLYGQVV